MDIVNLIAEFVGNQNVFQQNLSQAVCRIHERSVFFRQEKGRKMKHIADGLEYAGMILGWYLQQDFLLKLFGPPQIR